MVLLVDLDLLLNVILLDVNDVIQTLLPVLTLLTTSKTTELHVQSCCGIDYTMGFTV